MDWGCNRTYFNYSPVRKSAVSMKINYDLLNGVIHMEDIAAVLNPGNLASAFVPDKIQHYPIINSKINTLRGEEAARVFDWHVIVTNPYSISQIEEDKKQEFFQMVQGIVEDQSIDDQQAQKQIQEGQEYYDYNWQDLREIRANELIHHYSKELNFKQTFNDGFVDACLGSEIYQCGISGGEPFLKRLNPIKLRIFGSGYSNRVEDADVIIYEDYISRGKIVELYYDELSPSDIKKLSDDLPEFGGASPTTAEGAINDAYPFVGRITGENGIWAEGSNLEFVYDAFPELNGTIGSNLLPYDVAGNVRVIHVWWKSKSLTSILRPIFPIRMQERRLRCFG